MQGKMMAMLTISVSALIIALSSGLIHTQRMRAMESRIEELEAARTKVVMSNINDQQNLAGMNELIFTHTGLFFDIGRQFKAQAGFNAAVAQNIKAQDRFNKTVRELAMRMTPAPAGQDRLTDNCTAKPDDTFDCKFRNGQPVEVLTDSERSIPNVVTVR